MKHKYCGHRISKANYEDVSKRFWSKVTKNSVAAPSWNGTKCWLFNAYSFKGPQTSYGQFLLNGKMVRAHIVAFLLSGRKTTALRPCVGHHCDVKRCANPAHLWACSHQENMKDRNAKGRQFQMLMSCLACKAVVNKRGFETHWPRCKKRIRVKRVYASKVGEKNSNAKLSESDVKAIIQNLATGIPVKQLAKKYNVTKQTLVLIGKHKTWKHLDLML